MKEAFALAGFPATVNRGLEWGGVGEKPWGVVFSATVPLPVFFAAFVTEETHDRSAGVKAWAQEIFEARRGSRLKRGTILIQGSDSSIRLWSDMPEMEAAGLVLSFRWKPERLRKLGLRLVSRASIADRVLGAVVSRPRSVGMAEVPRRAGKDEPAAAGAPHLPAGDEGSEPLPQRSVCAAVAALRRAPTTTGALELLGMAARARPAQGDDLPVPTNTGGRCHLVVVLPGGGMIVVGGDMRTSWVAPPVAGFGEAERRTQLRCGNPHRVPGATERAPSVPRSIIL